MDNPLPVLDLQISGTATWVALAAARAAGLSFSTHDSWVSDEPLESALEKTFEAGYSPGTIWEDSRPRFSNREIVLESADWIVRVSQERRDYNCSIYTRTAEEASAILGEIHRFIPFASRQEKLLDVTFWYQSMHGPRSYDRQLQAPSWQDIQMNYPTATRDKLARLHAVELTDSSGKLILWQGQPGTGKTFALRALGEEWGDWCRIHYVLDPEKFFTEGDYLLTVILGNDNLPATSAAPQAPWRLIVLEDAGELLAKDAREKVGQGLSRLLNLCDGLLGQGLKVLVLITTNEEVGSLHSAVSRHGRCLSQVAFETFSSRDANEWLEAHGSSATTSKQIVVADLYAMLAGDEPIPVRSAGFLSDSLAVSHV